MGFLAKLREKLNFKEKDTLSIGWFERLKRGLKKSHEQVWGKLKTLFTGERLNHEQLEELEEILYGADLGPVIVKELVDAVKKEQSIVDLSSFKSYAFNFFKKKMDPVQERLDLRLLDFNELQKSNTKRPYTIMILGVNGVGKTTTIGKIATKLKKQGAKVVVGACDTFRAAAVDQLEVWCKRADVEMVRAKEGARPSGVAYEAMKIALEREADYLIIDTAGRLHTKENLLEELSAIENSMKKISADAQRCRLLVLDAITGQNAIKQSIEFNKTINLTGIVFTKCDGSSKAGSAIGIIDQLQVPITYIGVGESVDDLDIFDVDEYLKALLDI